MLLMAAAYALISKDGLSVENTIWAETEIVDALRAKGRIVRELVQSDVVSPGDAYDSSTDIFRKSVV